MILVAALVVGLCAGCPQGDTDVPEPSGGDPAPSGGPPAEAHVPPDEPPQVEEPPPPPTIPEVHMTDALRETCLVGVDDAMPDAELVDPEGQKQPLSGLRGEKLTLVLLWTRGSSEFSAMAAQINLEDLQKDVHEPYADKGVQVVAVNEADTPEDVKQTVEGAGVTFPSLSDPDGALFAQVAKERLPRPYLLDAEGKILWFDLEFSQATHDNLMQAIQVALGEIGEP
jgi:peroxiredoxin